jgi:hypothetical protein
MEDLILLTEELVKSIVKNSDSVKVKEFETDEEDTVLIQVLVDESDMGLAIGKEGRMANSIRTIIQAASYLKENKRIKINIDSF